MPQLVKNTSGFSLIELMVVVGIIGILVAIAALSTDFIRKERLTSATRELLADLQRARVDGMTTGPTATTGVVPFMRGAGIRLESSSKYVFFFFNDCNENYTYEANGCSGQREEARVNATTLRGTLALKINNLATNPSDNVVIFDRFGSPRAADGTQITSMNIIVASSATAGPRKCVMIALNKIREGMWDEATSTCKER